MRSLYFLLGIVLATAQWCVAQKSDFSHINFEKADQLALQYRDADLTNLPELVRNLTDGLETDVERFRAIYLWTCQNIKNDYGLYAKNKRKRERFSEDTLKLEAWNEKFKKKIFKTLLKRKRTICTGYAYMVASLCQLVNIKCVIVNGFAKPSSGNSEDLKDPNHSWNAVKLNNKWYLCDPTWASGVQDVKTGRFQFNYNDGLFLASPQLFAINHFPLEEQWFLSEDKPTFEDFVLSPILYNDAYTLLEAHQNPTKLINEVTENYTANFKYELKDKINPNDISMLIDNGFTKSTLNIDASNIEDNTLIIDYTFNKRGQYDMHLIYKDSYIATYVFKVKRLKTSIN